MTKAVTIVFPHQLYQHHPALQKDREVYLTEEWLYYRQYNFHRQKLGTAQGQYEILRKLVAAK